jgi:hypothetical protein
MFGALHRPPVDLDGADDLDLDAPIDTGAEDEVRALLFETPITIADREPDWLETTAPRWPGGRLPPRIPQRRRLGLVWLAVPAAVGVLATLSTSVALAAIWLQR